MEKFKYWSGKRDGTILSFEKDMEYGFSWPQRNYTCNFCTKEFKSGQALGGHMNMHRKDRAKMSLAAWPHATTMFRRINAGTRGHCMKSTSPFSISPRKEKVPGIEHLWSYKKNKAMIKNEPITLTRRKDTSTDWKGNDIIRFDLVQEPNDDLDLELRLG